jgi:hypothetical protein
MNRFSHAFWGFAGLSLILISSCAYAQEMPTTQPNLPTTLPDLPTTQPDLPRDAFRDFYEAVKGGDAGVVGALCFATDADSQKLVADLQAFAAAMADLHAAVKAKFGADAVDAVSPQLASEEAIDAMRETTAGDKANLVGDDVGPVDMVRTGGKWKVDIGSLLKQGGFGDNPDDFFKALTQAVARTTKDITAGKFTAAQDAAEALTIRQSAIGSSGTTTQPGASAQP